MLTTCLLFFLWDGANEDLWAKGNNAYQDGRYAKAIQTYEQLIEQGFRNGKLHFNLGNAYFKNGQLGKAIVHYSRAQRYLPGDTDIEHNLAIATQSRVDPPIDEEKEPIYRTFDRLNRSLSYSLVFYASLIALILAGLASIGWIVKDSGRRTLGYITVLAGLIGLLLLGFATIQYRHLTSRDMAVVIVPKVDVLSGPSTRETISFTIHEGIGCRILDRTEGWYRIRLANGYNGWVRRTDIEII